MDAGNPCVIVSASDIGLRGTELPDALNADGSALGRLEAIRAAGAVAMGLAQSPEQATAEMTAVPKVAFVAPPAAYVGTAGLEVGPSDVDLVVRMVSMGRLHHALPVTGAASVAVAARIPGSTVERVARAVPAASIRLGHPAGVIALEVVVEQDGGSWQARRVTLSRTARRLMEGVVLVPDPL